MNIELVNIRQLPWINKGNVYQITDLLTGLKYNIVGEHNNRRHADYVCSTKADTEIKLKTANGNFNNNWYARPCILTIGDRHFAAATHNATHPPDMLKLRSPDDIGHSGHFCLWVLGATTDGSTSYQDSMLRAVQQACEMTIEGKIEEMTQERFDEMLENWLRSQNELPPSNWATAELGEAFKKAVDMGITDGTRPQGIPRRQELIAMIVMSVEKMLNS
ncbi:MAG: hypothetical protein FWE29_05920 [Defluviitaleaceae bacterium]|nr:hypothetical protein [Defluviitaleaceae bacterium]